VYVTFCAYDQERMVGGPNAWLRRIAPSLHQQGVRVRVLLLSRCPPDQGATLRALQRDGIACAAIRIPRYTEDRVRWLLQRLREDPPDVFVPNLVVAAFYAARWVREAGIPTVGLIRGNNPFHIGMLDEFVSGSPAYRLSAMVCVSRFLEHMVGQRNPQNVIVRRMASAVPVPDTTTQPPADTLHLIYVGRLVEEQKRITALTEAVCRAVREVPGTAATLYGDGKARPSVERILATQGQNIAVQLAGFVDSTQMQTHMQRSHVVVLLSDYEGLPVAFMEAMACGLVPITLRMQSAIDELVEDEVTGLVVEDRGDSFVAAVRRVREEPGLWARLSRAARARVEQEFSIQVVTQRWIELFHDLMRDAGPRKTIAIPRHIMLPPVHPDLAREDTRKPPLHQRLRQTAAQIYRKNLGRVKYRVLRATHMLRRPARR